MAIAVAAAALGPQPGHPASGRHVRSTRPATVEVRAGKMLLLFFPASRADRRDVCVATARRRESLFEANEYCGVVSEDDFWSFTTSDRAVGGFAPRAVRRVSVSGQGAHHLRLPLSRHRTFLALFPASVRGTVVVSARLRDGRLRRQRLRLPPPLRRPVHPRRRPGAVFSDEVGEDIIGVSERRLLRRFGPPVTITRGGQPGCIYYELVGDLSDGWTFCIADGRVRGAQGGRIPPHEVPGRR